MSNYAARLDNKAKMKLDAANRRPERPRLNEEFGMRKNMMDAEMSIPNENTATSEMLDDLEKPGRSGGVKTGAEALFSGFKAGVKRKSILDDKERMKKYTSTMEKLTEMNAATNRELWKQEQLFNAQESVKPRLVAYLSNYQSMTPEGRNEYLRSSLQEFNEVAGTDYEYVDTIGSQPQKILVREKGVLQELDLMEFGKTSPEKKVELYQNSIEMQKADQIARQEYEMDMQQQQAQIRRLNQDNDRQDRVNQSRGQIPEGAVPFENLDPKSQNMHEKEMISAYQHGVKLLPVRDAVSKIMEVREKYPNLDTSIQSIISNPQKADSYVGIALKSVANQEERTAIELLGKYINRMNRADIEATTGVKPSDLFKQILVAGGLRTGMTDAASKQLSQEILQDLDREIDFAKEAQKGIQGRYVVLPKLGQEGQSMSPQASGMIVLQSPDGMTKSVPDTPENRAKVQEAVNKGYKVVGNG